MRTKADHRNRLHPQSQSRSQFPMSYFRPEIEAMAGYVPGEQPQGGEFIKLNTNENPYPPSPAVAGRDGRGGRAAAEISRPDGRAVPPARGRGAGRAAGLDPLRQRQRRHPDDRHADVRRPGAIAAVAVPELHPLPHAGRIAGRRLRRGPLPERLVAAAGVRRRPRRPAAGLPGQPEQPLGHGDSAGEGAGDRRAAAVPAAGRRGLRRFRRHELPGAGGPEREDHGLADAEQVVRPGRAAVRLRGGPAAADRAAGQGEGLVQLRRPVDRRRRRRHRRPGVAGREPGEDPGHARAAGAGNAGFRVCNGRFAGQLCLEHPSAPAGQAALRGTQTRSGSWSDTWTIRAGATACGSASARTPKSTPVCSS